MQKICVIGSLNMDMTAKVKRFPAPGETMSGESFLLNFGGKGANQAVALGRLGANVAMAGMLGNDVYAQSYLDHLEKNHVDALLVRRCDAATGMALIEVSGTGENKIITFAGANGEVSKEYMQEIFPMLLQYDIFLLQLESPPETIAFACEALKQAGKTIILDPAPVKPLSDALLSCIDYLTPNETELKMLTGIEIQEEEKIHNAAKLLLHKGVRCVIAKSGVRGAYLITQDGITHVPPYRVNAVDTTAAGDAFNAGFAYALANAGDSFNLAECVRFANATGALATTALGAQTAMPDLQQALDLMGQ